MPEFLNKEAFNTVILNIFKSTKTYFLLFPSVIVDLIYGYYIYKINEWCTKYKGSQVQLHDNNSKAEVLYDNYTIMSNAQGGCVRTKYPLLNGSVNELRIEYYSKRINYWKATFIGLVSKAECELEAYDEPFDHKKFKSCYGFNWNDTFFGGALLSNWNKMSVYNSKHGYKWLMDDLLKVKIIGDFTDTNKRKIWFYIDNKIMNEKYPLIIENDIENNEYYLMIGLLKNYWCKIIEN